MFLSRRNFLVRLIVVTIATAFSPLAWAASKTKKSKRNLAQQSKRRVVIIGAGLSGLYAAVLAKRRGYDVTVLEASNRFGGKARGERLDGAFFDVGGQAFNKDMTRVATLGQRLGLHVLKKPKQEGFYCDGDDVMTGAAFEALRKETEALSDAASELFPKSLDPKERLAFAKMNVMEWARPMLSPKALPYFKSMFQAEWCASPESISLLHYLDFSRSFPTEEDHDEMANRFAEGMAGLAAGLAAEIKSAMKFETPVKEIFSSDDVVRVVAEDAEFLADDVILALPMPQLSKIALHGEGLDELRNYASSFVGGAVRKILLHYHRPFWKDKPRDGAFSSPSGVALMDNSDVAGKFYSLVAFVGGPATHDNLSREKILERVALVVGDEAKKPAGYLDQSWVDTEYLPGGYCSNRPPGEWTHLRPPAKVGRLYLAGSESSDVYPSYIEGALAAAERAVKAMGRQQS